MRSVTIIYDATFCTIIKGFDPLNKLWTEIEHFQNPNKKFQINRIKGFFEIDGNKHTFNTSWSS